MRAVVERFFEWPVLYFKDMCLKLHMPTSFWAELLELGAWEEGSEIEVSEEEFERLRELALGAEVWPCGSK